MIMIEKIDHHLSLLRLERFERDDKWSELPYAFRHGNEVELLR